MTGSSQRLAASPDQLVTSPQILVVNADYAISDTPVTNSPTLRNQYRSPIRQHRRTSSRNAGARVKETLDARSHYGSSEDDGTSIVRVNQYILKNEIGRGSFGAVHLAVDQYGAEFAVKEFSKSRLRKRAQSNLLRKPNQKRPSGYLAPDSSLYPPLHHQSSSGSASPVSNNSLDLIKEEIAIMKKLDHNNLVSLIEVLDDPEEDSLYMVLEMCKKGVVMKVGLDDTADPYDDETCRCWFRDMILGIEYLHAQGIIHRDIKPDNCLVTEDDTLKIVDFGVSEMFEKHSPMSTSKHAGSPAFMPPELCVVKHGLISGRAADIWSMGVTLYCLRYGKIPFTKDNLLELYDSIRDDELRIDSSEQADFRNLLTRLFEKDPDKRINMKQLRVHPWVTQHGQDPLLSEEENCSDPVAPPTEAEKNHAITDNMGHLMAVMGAVKRFKQLLISKRPSALDGIIDRGTSHLTSPPGQIKSHGRPYSSLKGALHKAGSVLLRERTDPTSTPPQPEVSPAEPHSPEAPSPVHTGAGQAQSAVKETQYLCIGPGNDAGDHHAQTPPIGIVAESPGAVETPIFEEAYRLEVERIKGERGEDTTIHSNKRVEKQSHWAAVKRGFVAGHKGDDASS